jgi:hypothetical protein
MATQMREDGRGSAIRDQDEAGGATPGFSA